MIGKGFMHFHPFSFGNRQAWHRPQIPGFKCAEASEALHALYPHTEEVVLPPDPAVKPSTSTPVQRSAA